MAAHAFYIVQNRRARRRQRIFRDRTNPMDVFTDRQIHRRFRLSRQCILQLVEEIHEDIVHFLPRKGCLSPLLQVCLTLRYYATGSFMPVVGDLIGVDRATACRTVVRVTNALFKRVGQWIHLPDQQHANRQKIKFYNMRGFPDVIGCIDGTHVRIQAPTQHEEDYVNRKNFHSMNVQVICDADLMFINAVAQWPGSVHDAKILRNSPLFHAFEAPNPPLDGLILGDSGYMLRSWLMTPVRHPETREEEQYNYVHSATRCTVERAIGVAKQRWRCLRVGIICEPKKVTRIILVCLMLANRARALNLPPPPPPDPDSDDEDEPVGDFEVESDHEDSPEEDDRQRDGRPVLSEAARLEAGKRARERIIDKNFRGRLRR